MALEIEFEDDDQTDTAWPLDASDAGGARGTGAEDADPGALTAEASETRTGSPRSGVAALLPERFKPLLPLQLGVLVAAFVVGASTVAGFLAGRTAAQDRTVVELHMAGGGAYTVGPATPSGTGRWTDTFARRVSLNVVNDGPKPVTLLSGRVTGPYENGAFGFPRGGMKIAAGATATLHAATTIDCRGVFGAVRLTNGSSAPQNTVADFEVATADGRTGGTSLLVDLASAAVVSAVCAQVPPPVQIGPAQFSPLIPPASYQVSYPIDNAAPFPLRVTTLSAAVAQWNVAGGLTVTANGDSAIPADSTGTYYVQVTVSSCSAALNATDDQFGAFPLVFTDVGGGPNPDMFVQEAPLVAHAAIAQACHGR